MKTNVTTKIKDLKFGVKEDQITLTIDGNITDEQVSILRKIKKQGVAFVSFSSSQTELEDYDRPRPQHEGIRGTIDQDGTARVEDDGKQVTFDDVNTEAQEAAEEEGKQDEEIEEEDPDGVEPEYTELPDDMKDEVSDDPMHGVDEEDELQELDGEDEPGF